MRKRGIGNRPSTITSNTQTARQLANLQAQTLGATGPALERKEMADPEHRMSQLQALLEENDRRANEIKESIEIEKSKAAQQASSSRGHLGPSETDIRRLIAEATRPLHDRIEQLLDSIERRQETSSRTSSPNPL